MRKGLKLAQNFSFMCELGPIEREIGKGQSWKDNSLIGRDMTFERLRLMAL